MSDRRVRAPIGAVLFTLLAASALAGCKAEEQDPLVDRKMAPAPGEIFATQPRKPAIVPVDAAAPAEPDPMPVAGPSVEGAMIYALVGRSVVPFDMDTATGALTMRPRTTVDTNLTHGAFLPNARGFYAVGGTKVFAFTIDPASGAVTANGDPQTLATAGVEIAIDPTGQNLVVTHAAKTLSVLKISPDGKLAAPLANPMPPGTGTDPRQIRFDQSGAVAFVTSVGADKKTETLPDGGSNEIPEQIGRIDVFAFDAAKGQLAARSFAETGATHGPRHLDLHPNGKVLYAAGERGTELFTFDVAGDKLTQRGKSILTARDKDIRPPRAGDVLVHPNGKFLYVTNRTNNGSIDIFPADAGITVFSGGYNDIALFTLGADGTPTLEKDAFVDSRGIEPRQLVLDPKGGSYLLVGNQRKMKRWWMGALVDVIPNVTVFGVDKTTGRLSHLKSYGVSSFGELQWVGAALLKR
jgi:6-phosphogluconolactonase (cycloisomerase 2 family)